MLGKIGIFCGKSFEKSFFSTNSTEFSAENHFPRKKCTKYWPQIGRLFTLGTLMKIKKVAQASVLLFPQVYIMH
jgi:hypothetical protein